MASISANGSNGFHKFTLNVEENSTSAENNTSLVSWSFVLSPIIKGYNWEYNVTVPVWYSVTINGSVYSGNIMIYDGSSTVTVRSGTLTIPHNSDGSKSISFSFSVSSYNAYYLPGSASASGSMALTKIPRYLSITSLEIADRTETSVVVRWSTSDPRSSTYYSFDNGENWIGSATHGETLASDGKSGTFNILNLTANATYNMKVKFKRTDSGLETESGVVTFATYDYPHCTNSPDFIIGDALTLDFYNPLGRNISVAGYAKTDGTEIFTGTTNGTRLVGFNDPNSVNKQYASIPISQSGAYTVTVVYNDTPKMRDTGNVYRIRGNEIPTIESFDYYDGNESVVDITVNNKQIVQNKSYLYGTYSPATPNYGASKIVRYVLECNGKSRAETTVEPFSLGTIDSERDVDFTLTVMDSRGLSASKTIKVTMLAHSDPTAIVTLNRLNNYEDETYLTVDGSVSSVNGKNTMNIQYRYKILGGEYGSFVTIADNVKQTLSFDKNNVYIFNVVITDSFGAKYDKEHTLGKGVFPFFIDTEKSSVGVNCFPQNEKSFEASGFISLGSRGSVDIEPGETKDIIIYLTSTALINFRFTGAHLEIARFYYLFRTNQYFARCSLLFEDSHNSTAPSVPVEQGNLEQGYKFSFTNNHTERITVMYGILQLC